LTLVAAPAGYGKTTLLSEGIRDSSMPVGWLTLDENDNDPAHFWSYLISALQTVQVDIGKSAWGLLQSQQAPPIESISTIIVNEMSEVNEDFALVLDDYHMIEAQPIHDSMNFLLNHLPLQAHLVIASRTDPLLPLARLRAQNQLVEVRADDLRFTSEEATAFLNDVMNLRLSDEDVTTLESRTEGWIAGLQLAAISMQGLENVSAFIAEFSGSSRYILDYLVEEVLHRQEVGIQSFLLETSILDRFTASLCNAVTGRNDSQEILAQLEGINLFLMPLDSERRWYRYHHLLADLLRNQFMLSQKERMTELHLRASQWFEQEGLTGEAIDYSLHAKDHERAASLIESVAPTMVIHSYNTIVLSWLKKLPNEMIIDRPWLSLSSAIANSLTGHSNTVELFLHSAESAMSKIEDQYPDKTFPDHARIRSRVRAVRIYETIIQGNIQHAIELCHESLQYPPEDDLVAHAAVVGNLGWSYWFMGDLQAARQYFEEAAQLGQSSNHPYVTILSTCYLADIYRLYGHLYQAAEKYREAIRLGTQLEGENPLPLTGEAYIGLSRLFFEWNDIGEAIRHANIGTKLAESGGVITSIVIGYLMLAWQNQACGNINASLEALHRAEGIPLESIDSHTLCITSAWKARLSLTQGNLNTANRWITRQEPELNLRDIPEFLSELPYLTLVRLRIAQGEVDEIPDLLECLRQKVEEEKRTGSLIEILALQSVAWQAQGDLDQALATLEHALSLAEPEGYVRTFVDEGEPMAKLLRLAASRGITKKYVRKLLASFYLGSESQSRVLPAEGAAIMSDLVEPLSERELEVLRLIVAGMSNREIGEKLIIGEGTVKTHINNIYGKLDVQSRTQAIARARELSLL